jgi:organic radical activating enzyme
MRIVVNLYLTWNCNFYCAHCIHECGPKEHDHMTDAQLQTAFSFVEWLYTQNHTVVVVGLTGGEPTLHPKFWDKVMPMVDEAKKKLKISNWEMHSNASIPVPPSSIDTYRKFFNRIMVGHDQFHRKFKSLSELHLDDYTQLTNELVLIKNEYKMVSTDGTRTTVAASLRMKGRAKKSMQSGLIEGESYVPANLDCAIKRYALDNLCFNFTPWHINHCWEHSHPEPEEVNHGNFHSYDMPWDYLLNSAIQYVSNHCGQNCTQPCYGGWGNLRKPVLDEPVKVNQNQEVTAEA